MIGQAFIIGIIFFQIIYMIMQWYFFKRKEFLYYILYLVLFVFFLYAFYEPQIGFTNFFGGDLENIKSFTRIEGLLIFWSYVVFTRFFTDADLQYPSLHKAMENLEHFLLLGVVLQILFLVISTNPNHKELFSWLFFIPGFFYAFYIGFRLLQYKVKLNSFIIIGSLFAISGSFVQAIVDNYAYFFGNNYHSSSLIMELGFIFEFVFLNIGFMYKTKVLQQQQDKAREDILQTTIEKNEIASQLYEVRNKLSMDLHDDVSSSLSSIRILSELLANSSDADNMKIGANKIISVTEELSAKVNVLVWSFNEKNDTIIRFVEYIKTYSENFSVQTNIDCKVEMINPTSTQFIINGNTRKNIFLCIKEALHNVLKYAKATNVNINIVADDNGLLSITISDNGIGFLPTAKPGNGIINMKKRMKSIDGSFAISSENGTKVLLACRYK
jgi:signal transduction histidine kinase